MFTHEDMFTTLATNICRVKFTKVNGEERDMTCTRNLERVPMDMRPKGENEADELKTTIRVFDTKAQGWRSFRVDSVKEFEVV